MDESENKPDALFDWAKEQNLLEDPERISKLSDEASRRWGHLMTRHDISEIVKETLNKIKIKVYRLD